MPTKAHAPTPVAGVSGDATTKLLHSTTDASIWAREWCRIASEIVDENPDEDGVKLLIDEGWMIGWFANAIEVAKDSVRRAQPAPLRASRGGRATMKRPSAMHHQHHFVKVGRGEVMGQPTIIYECDVERDGKCDEHREVYERVQVRNTWGGRRK